MKFILGIIIVFLSITQIYATTIELTQQKYVDGEIKYVSEKEIFLKKGDVLLVIDKNMIYNIFDDSKPVKFDDLLSKDYSELNLDKYKVIRIKADNLNSKELAGYLKIKKKDENAINSEYFIELENGKKIFGNFKEKIKFPGERYFLTDKGEKINLEDVKAYKNKDGFFHKIPDSFNKRVFAQRVLKGKIDLYSRYTIQHTSTIGTWGPGGSFTPSFGGTSYGYNIDYFKKDGKLLKVNYRNLKAALSDNQNCVKYLKKYKKLSYIQAGLAIAGFGMIIGGFTTINKETGLSDSGKLWLISGGIVINATWITHFAKQDIIRNVLKEYNK